MRWDRWRWRSGGGVVIGAPEWLIQAKCGPGKRALLRHGRLGLADIVEGSPKGPTPTSLPTQPAAPTTMSASVSRNGIRHFQLRLDSVTSDADANKGPAVGAARRGAKSATPTTPSIPQVAHSGE